MAATMTEGFRAPQVCNLVGITYRQLDYWARTDLVQPSMQAGKGSGGHGRLYTFGDIVQLKVVKKLLDAGMSLKKIRTAMDILREQLADADDPRLWDVVLLSDGATIFAVHSNAEVFDVFQRGHGVFGIAVGPLVDELKAETDRLGF